jgi:hypothetical protein
LAHSYYLHLVFSWIDYLKGYGSSTWLHKKITSVHQRCVKSTDSLYGSSTRKDRTTYFFIDYFYIQTYSIEDADFPVEEFKKVPGNTLEHALISKNLI